MCVSTSVPRGKHSILMKHSGSCSGLRAHKRAGRTSFGIFGGSMSDCSSTFFFILSVFKSISSLFFFTLWNHCSSHLHLSFCQVLSCSLMPDWYLFGLNTPLLSRFSYSILHPPHHHLFLPSLSCFSYFSLMLVASHFNLFSNPQVLPALPTFCHFYNLFYLSSH